MGTLPVHSNFKTKLKPYKNGNYGKHILRTFVRNGREWQFHATKGWRSYRVTA